jgi:hypothetical protein
MQANLPDRTTGLSVNALEEQFMNRQSTAAGVSPLKKPQQLHPLLTRYLRDAKTAEKVPKAITASARLKKVVGQGACH